MFDKKKYMEIYNKTYYLENKDDIKKRVKKRFKKLPKEEKEKIRVYKTLKQRIYDTEKKIEGLKENQPIEKKSKKVLKSRKK